VTEKVFSEDDGSNASFSHAPRSKCFIYHYTKSFEAYRKTETLPKENIFMNLTGTDFLDKVYKTQTLSKRPKFNISV
jgi:hypothetical protein